MQHSQQIEYNQSKAILPKDCDKETKGADRLWPLYALSIEAKPVARSDWATAARRHRSRNSSRSISVRLPHSPCLVLCRWNNPGLPIDPFPFQIPTGLLVSPYELCPCNSFFS